MLQTFLTNAIVKIVLGWLKSLWDDFMEKRQNMELGRQEVRDALARKDQEIANKINDIRLSDPDFATAINGLRDYSDRRDDEVSSNTSSN